MTDKVTVKKSDYGYDLNFTVKDADGTARAITDYTVTLKVWLARDPATLIVDGACTPDVAASGTCHYTVADGDFDTKREYQYELELTKDGVVESSETGILVVEESG